MIWGRKGWRFLFNDQVKEKRGSNNKRCILGLSIGGLVRVLGQGDVVGGLGMVIGPFGIRGVGVGVVLLYKQKVHLVFVANTRIKMCNS